MEVHRQTCQLCGSHKMRNILARENGEPDKVFVQCADCHELVARYSLGRGGYFHAHKGFESYLRSMSRSGEMMSSKNIQADYQAIEEAARFRFKEIMRILAEENKED
ncbi:MAG: hypothetical protein A2600_09165 [Candidatus Lambdaproteobacteria bacterium RIFOXYD1_FULL_56_27]|uniref:Uncharacterized protein n=1 Tax=Candidatus Lambdaproteobacteria bacterium RIFOXYD2_FULL_56_26 TaxID=1817773 RepID=A0A1F6GL88_9PROT|nr:MAG: hypothetical protein A2557_13290 [Candidatus Lambdaproteobacteria bacterium RIFOXYD2_FULL_56_26]OGH03587.1 MAG: hypothetical protein A2426_06475 [Candidatus Lambdaproteobacteria bacterium RIFOXYC1_FULL_56_13]OGH08724.1 MAG: hypothetical protein A2600_09165 [Candidatus Lambdaproteobacteria bacterium RIFOXYD1_FULL_56_27]